MPRKAATTTDTGAAEAPRRSTRIASLPKTEVPQPKPRVTKKRNGEDAGTSEEGKSKNKKVKAVEEEEKKEEAEVAPESNTELEPEPEPENEISNIEIGDSLPSLTLKNEKGEDIEIGEIAKDQGVVVFLVPKADTPGCTNQACGFRDIYSEFKEVGYAVYCLSADAPGAQAKWQTKKELPYSLISDPKRTLITALGAGEGGKTKRSHFIFDKGGVLVEKKLPVKPVDSPKLALEFIKSRSEEQS